jgi:uncharacterized protein (TIGR02246 family)
MPLSTTTVVSSLPTPHLVEIRVGIRLVVSLASLALLVGCTIGRTSAAASGTAPARVVQDVEAVYRAGIEAFNRHSLGEFTAQFADDVRMYTPTGWVEGRAAVVQRFRETFAQFPNARMEIDSLVVRAVGPETATVGFRWRVYPLGQGPAFHGVGSGVYVRRDGRWLEVLEHETVVRIDAALQQRPSSARP